MRLSRRGLLAGALGLPIVGLLGKGNRTRDLPAHDMALSTDTTWTEIGTYSTRPYNVATADSWTTGSTFTMHIRDLRDGWTERS